MTSEDLKQVMEQHKLDVNQIAQACYVTPAAVYRWLDGTRKISKSTGAHIVNYLGKNK